MIQSAKNISFNNGNAQSSCERAWYALYTKPRSEFKAAEKIKENGINYYLPAVTRVKQWSDRKKTITEPLLRSYLFIFASEKERLISLEQNSVVRCISDNGRPAKIPEWQIENLRKVLHTRSELYIKEGLIAGTKVLIKSGPFEGVIGIVQSGENGSTVAVLIDLLNRSIIAHLPDKSDFDVINQ